MKRKFLIIALAMGSISFAQDTCVAKPNNANCLRIIVNDSLCWKHGGLGRILSNQCIDFTNAKNLRCTIRSYHSSELCNFHRWSYYMLSDSTYTDWYWWTHKLNTNKVR